MGVSGVSSSDTTTASTASTKSTGAGNKGFLKSFLSKMETKYAMETKGQEYLQFLREMFPNEMINPNYNSYYNDSYNSYYYG